MTEFALVQIVALVGWLVLMLFGYASYRLNWKQGVKQVLIWACIFAALTLVISFFLG